MTKQPPQEHAEPAMSLEELARRMLATPATPRDEMAQKKARKPRKKK
jgi:hypothetical protein